MATKLHCLLLWPIKYACLSSFTAAWQHLLLWLIICACWLHGNIATLLAALAHNTTRYRVTFGSKFFPRSHKMFVRYFLWTAIWVVCTTFGSILTKH